MGANEVTSDAMLLVTGVEIDRRSVDESGLLAPEDYPENNIEPMASDDTLEPEIVAVPEGLEIPQRTWTNNEGVKVTADAVYKVGADFVSLKVGESWIEYALKDLSESDGNELLQAAKFVDQ